MSGDGSEDPEGVRICRHVLVIVPHAPGWLDCPTCAACFRHRDDCPGLGMPGCAAKCMGGADPEVTALDALFVQSTYDPRVEREEQR